MHTYLIFVRINHFIKIYYIGTALNSWKKYKNLSKFILLFYKYIFLIYYCKYILFIEKFKYFRQALVLLFLPCRSYFMKFQKLKYLSVNYRLVLRIKILFSFEQNSFSIYLRVNLLNLPAQVKYKVIMQRLK